MQELTDSISKTVQELFEEDVDVELTRPDEQFGDYATNVALRLSKKLGRNPRDIAQKIADELKENDELTDVSVAGPGFINVRVKDEYLAQALLTAVRDAPNDVYGSNKSGEGHTVLCEFPSPNMAKPFSVGHIRAALQGWAVAQVMRLSGYKVITDNHVGDSGTPFGKWVVGFLRYSSDEQLAKEGINELARVYIAVTADLKKEKEAGGNEIADEVQSWLQKLEAEDPEAEAYSQHFNKISFDHMHQVMERLHISTDYEYGEAGFIKRGKELADELLKKGVAKESDGAVIVELDEYGIDTPIMLKKANGTALYATTDLATMEFREKEWAPDTVFIHTGQEQALYFNQLNALAKKAGYRDNINHLWHGLVDQIDQETGERAKMSSRKGVVLLNDMLDEGEKRAKAIAKDASEDDVKAVSLGAIKFTDFTADRKKGTLFDWDSMFNVQGFSGPAVQYAAVRIKSILSKATVEPRVSEGYDWASEHELLLELLAFPGLIEELSHTYELHKLAAYLYGLARALNRYYEQTPILKSTEVEQHNRLWILKVTEGVLTIGLDVLGIPVPERM